jgi:hypothetical protein
MTASALGHALGPIIFIGLMVGVLFGGLVLSQLWDPALWIPKPSGLGWTLDFGHPHAQLVIGFSIGWLLVVALGLLGLSRPDAPIIGGLMQLLAQLAGIS